MTKNHLILIEGRGGVRGGGGGGGGSGGRGGGGPRR